MDVFLLNRVFAMMVMLSVVVQYQKKEYISQRRKSQVWFNGQIIPRYLTQVWHNLCHERDTYSYLKTIVKQFVVANSINNDKKVVRIIRRFSLSEWKQNYCVCYPSDFLISLSPTYMSHDFVNIVIVHWNVKRTEFWPSSPFCTSWECGGGGVE